MKKLGILLFLGLALGACQDSEKVLPKSVGAINEISLVIENDLWEGAVGDSLRRYFAAPVDGLPWDEPLFTIRQVSPEVFTDFVRTRRNVLIAKVDSTESAGIKNDMFAKPQQVAILKSTTEEGLMEQVAQYSQQIISEFKQMELEESQKRFNRSLNKEKDLEELGISLTMPSIYKMAKKEDNFYWIERLIHKGTMNILVYEMPLGSIPNDSTRVEAIIKMRDSIGEKYVPGREEGMYMITEKAYAPYVFDAELAGRKAIETKGMWEVKNFFMAGPFLNYIVEDKPNDRLLVLEGFTFAPSTNKRDYMFELEAIIKTLEFAEEEGKSELASNE
ncbi:DUF4837 family protein [Robertkochia marina]|uniref:DUF4837 family protein n=1 Tax=Robertkochia marina TaxID=1227945 RepID=A0A4S3M364_9FLAO|nr:DUF4837 family protein [Robertkochia marina]THD69330.1 DUF4837 family protein [Robertkochia marina]TRZ47409.1 DUF4837 family protein [Robertkochia marina]